MNAVPILHYLFPVMPESDTLRRWHRTHDYQVWTDCRSDADPQLALWEAHAGGVLRVPDDNTVMHVVSGGVPHHVEGLFGYWRACDSDIVWIRTRHEGSARHVMVLGGCPGAYRKDVILWVCPACATQFNRHEILTGPKGLGKFLRAQAEIVASFNADESLRTCPKCNAVHPLAYPYRGEDGAPEARAGDPAW